MTWVRLIPFSVLGALAIGQIALAQSGIIDVSPHPCVIPAGQSLCTATVQWSASVVAAVYVSQDGGSEGIMATGSSGSIPAPWIQIGHTYDFWLYDFSSGTKGALINAAAPVTGIPTPGQFSFTNTSRAISPHFVVGDTWLISVTNASNGIPVEVRWTTPQGGQIVYIVGYTVSGSFQSSTTVLAQNVGIWTAEWRVGGQIVSSNLTEIINLPTSVLKGPTFPGSEDCAADSDQPYGFIGIDMSYKLSQRVDEIPMFLIGQVATFGQYESEFGNGPSPVADDPSGGGGFGACGTAPFTNFTFQTRLWIRIGGVTGNMVRLNDWVQTSNAAHSGNLKNNNDFSITR